jgi:4'-phosphopantetheinyl transferase
MIPTHTIHQPSQLAETNLQPDEVHIWYANLAVSAEVVQSARRYLSPEESAKAARFHFTHDRDHFIVAHALLRLLIAHYCLLTPDTVEFVVNAYGKPALQASSGQAPFYFNLSHTRGLALCAFTRLCELGVDVEHMRTNIEYTETAIHFFSAQEVAKLNTLPETEQADGFFNAWTRKEAYIKARGKGLSLPLHAFDVSLLPSEPAALLEIREPDQDASAWSMYALPTPPHYKAALTLPSHAAVLHCWQWQNDFFL